jgi:environmental stress-induced protein Ves
MPQPQVETLRILRRASFKTVPWKNGGGVTHEAIRVPATGDSFRWRISVAEIGASGPFSDFQGYQRKMVLLRGLGLSLSFADGAHRRLQQVGDMVEFDGAPGPHCELLGGPCVDLNLMVADAIPGARARVQSLSTDLAVEALAGESLLIFAIAGAVVVEPPSGGRETLETWDLAILSHVKAAATRLRSAAKDAAAQVFLANLRDT